MEISIIIPCYNEENNINLIFDDITNTITNVNYELIFVDDGSTDKTLHNLKEIYQNRNNIKIISFSKNYGQDKAILAGLRESTGEFVTIIDADMQQDPRYIIEMYNILKNNSNYDIVAACPIKREDSRLIALLKKFYYKIINKATEKNTDNEAGCFRMFRKPIVNEIINFKEYFWFAKGIFKCIGYNTYYIKYAVRKRANGKSKYSFKKLMRDAFEGINGFTDLSAKAIRIIGIILFLISLIFIGIEIGRYIFNSISFSHINIIIFLLLFIGGINIILFSIILEAIRKVYIESKNRPPYIIKEKLD